MGASTKIGAVEGLAAQLNLKKSKPCVVSVEGNNLTSRANANQTATYKLSYSVKKACMQIQLVFANYYVSAANAAEQPSATTLPIKAAVELADGTIHPVTFSGARSYTIPVGKTITSDPLDVYIAADEVFFVRTYVNNANNGEYTPTGRVGVGLIASQDRADSGAITANTTDAGYGPVYILGKTVEPTNSIMVLGSDIELGTGDDYTAGVDYIHQAFANNAIINMSVASLQAQHVTRAHRTIKNGIAGNVDAVLISLGKIDVGNRTYAQIKADLETLFKEFAFQGAKVFVVTIPPKTTSTDNFRTVENQTKALSAPNETIRVQVNTWLRTVPTNVTGCFDICKRVEANADNEIQIDGGYWFCPPTLDSGNASAGGAGSITDSSKTWTTNQWAGKQVILTGGTSAGSQATIQSNDGTVLTVTSWSAGNPDATSDYVIVDALTTGGSNPSWGGHKRYAQCMRPLDIELDEDAA